MGRFFLSSRGSDTTISSAFTKVQSSVLMLPLEQAGQMMEEAGLADLMSLARAGTIPQDLLWDILHQVKTLQKQDIPPFMQS